MQTKLPSRAKTVVSVGLRKVPATPPTLNHRKICVLSKVTYNNSLGQESTVTQFHLPSKGSLAEVPYTSVVEVNPYGSDDRIRTSISDEVVAILVVCTFLFMVIMKHYTWKFYVQHFLPEHVENNKQNVCGNLILWGAF